MNEEEEVVIQYVCMCVSLFREASFLPDCRGGNLTCHDASNDGKTSPDFLPWKKQGQMMPYLLKSTSAWVWCQVYNPTLSKTISLFPLFIHTFEVKQTGIDSSVFYLKVLKCNENFSGRIDVGNSWNHWLILKVSRCHFFPENFEVFGRGHATSLTKINIWKKTAGVAISDVSDDFIFLARVARIQLLFLRC